MYLGMHDMRTIATDDPVAWCVCQSVCNALLRPAKTAKRIEVLFVIETFARAVHKP